MRGSEMDFVNFSKEHKLEGTAYYGTACVASCKRVMILHSVSRSASDLFHFLWS